MGECYTQGGGAAMSTRTRWARWQWALGSVAEGAPSDEVNIWRTRSTSGGREQNCADAMRRQRRAGASSMI